MSEPTRPPATHIPAQPARLVLGDRQIPIDEWPLARSVEEHRSVELRQPSPDLLVIEPQRRAGTVSAVQGVAIFLGGAMPSLMALAFDVPAWAAALIGVLTVALLVVLVSGIFRSLRRIRFDRPSGLLVIERRTGFRHDYRPEKSYPLQVIQAVQLLYNGRHSVTEPQGQGERQTISCREFWGYELNLILDDPQTPRLILFSLTDWQWLRQAGQAIGDLLAVPVIDKLYHGA
jgi:hypothetical protein